MKTHTTIKDTRAALRQLGLRLAAIATIIGGTAQAATEVDQANSFPTGSDGYQADVAPNYQNLLAYPGTTLTVSGGAPASPTDGGGTSTTYGSLIDGSFGSVPAPGGGGPGAVAIRNGWILTYTFAAAQDIATIDAFTSWGDSGRIWQDYSVLYATEAAPTTFLPFATVAFHPDGNSTWVRLTPEGSLRAKAIRFAFANQQNGYVGFSELVVKPVNPVAYTPWTYARWTGNADSGIDELFNYTVAVNLGGGATEVNGVPFEAAALSGANFSISGAVSTFNNDANNVIGDGSRNLANDFIYNANPRVITLNNLTPGLTYEATFFSVGWEAAGRTQYFADGNDTRVIDQDAFGDNNGIRISCVFEAADTTKQFTISPVGAGTFHLYAFANREVPTDPKANIITFGPGAVVGHPVNNAANITWVLPFGTNLRQLAPTFTLSAGATVTVNGSPIDSGDQFDFSEPVHYIVTSSDGLVINDFTVTASITHWTYGPWTGDEDSGIDSAFFYPVAVNLGGAGVMVNGVPFQSSTLSGANFAIGGGVSMFNNDANNISAPGSRILANDFIYNGNPRTITLNNLVPGQVYETTLFSVGWEAAGRLQNFSDGTDSLVVDQDLYGNNNGIKISYTFTATAPSKVLSITSQGIGTFHLYALVNRNLGTAPQANILAFGAPNVSIPEPVNNAANIVWVVPNGTDVTSLPATFTLSPGATATVDGNAVESGDPFDFTNPVHYIVTSSDGEVVNDYTVTVIVSQWTYAPWTGDADSGIDGTSLYHSAVNLAGPAITVNGVPFQASALSGPNFSIGGGVSVFNNDANNVNEGASRTLANNFIYNGAPRTITLNNLTAGRTYELTLFSVGWEAAGRLQNFSAGLDNIELDQDLYGDNNGIRINHQFVAASDTKVITISPLSLGTFHLYAFAVRRVATSPEANILAFGPGAFVSEPAGGIGVINWIVPSGADVTSLPATFTLSVGATATVGGNAIESGDLVNFTSPVHYLVTSSDGLVQNDYTVTVYVAPPAPAEVDNSASFPAGSDGYQSDLATLVPNLLALPDTTLTVSDGAPATPTVREGPTSDTYGTLVDGSFGLVPVPGGGGSGEVSIETGWTLTYTLAAPHAITQIDTFSGWGDSGRIWQDYTVSYSTPENPSFFIPLANVAYHPGGNSTWVNLVPAEAIVAKAIRFTFGAQQNGYVGYTELVVQGTDLTPLSLSVPTYDANEDRLTLTWNSIPGAVYVIESTQTVADPMSWSSLVSGVASGGTSTSFQIEAPTPGTFYRIKRQ